MTTDAALPENTITTGRYHRLGIAAAYLVLGALVLVPLLFTTVPTLIDYPSHLARVWMTAQGNALDSTHYVVRWRWIPNLAIELMVPFLARWMDVERAGWLFVAVAMLLPVAGTVALRKALFGRVGLWPLAAFLFVYNAILQWGFVNFLLGMGVALLLFAGWVGSARRPLVPRLAVFTVAAVSLYYLHLFALGIYALLVGAWEGGAWLREWCQGARVGRVRALFRAGAPLLQFMPVGLIFLLGAGGEGPRYTAYGGFAAKIYAVAAPMSFSDLGVLLGLLLFPLAFLAWCAGLLRIAPGMGWPILALVLAGVAMPNWMLGSWGADMRIPAFLPFLVIAASQPVALNRPVRAILACATLTLLTVRVVGLAASWRDMDAKFTEFRIAARGLPHGSRLLVVMSDRFGVSQVPGMPFLLARRLHTEFFHMPMLAIIECDAFVPYLYTSWTTIALRRAEARPYHSIGAPMSVEELRDSVQPDRHAALLTSRDILGAPPYWANWWNDFDVLLWIDFGRKPDNLPARLRERHAGSFFHLYDIER